MYKTQKIPYISDRKVEIMASKIKPIANKGDTKYYLGNYTLEELKNNSFRFNLSKHILTPVDFDELEVLTEISTFHKKTKTAFFTPTLTDIYAQIPKNLLHDAVAFECRFDEDVSTNYQLGKVILYKKKNV